MLVPLFTLLGSIVVAAISASVALITSRRTERRLSSTEAQTVKTDEFRAVTDVQAAMIAALQTELTAEKARTAALQARLFDMQNEIVQLRRQLPHD